MPVPEPVVTRVSSAIEASLRQMSLANGYSRDWTVYAPTGAGESAGTAEQMAEPGQVQLLWLGPSQPDAPTERHGHVEHYRDQWAVVLYVEASGSEVLDAKQQRAFADVRRAMGKADFSALGRHVARPKYDGLVAGTDGSLDVLTLVFTVPYATQFNDPYLLPGESAGA